MNKEQANDIERQRREGSDRMWLMRLISKRALENFNRTTIFRKFVQSLNKEDRIRRKDV